MASVRAFSALFRRLHKAAWLIPRSAAICGAVVRDGSVGAGGSEAVVAGQVLRRAGGDGGGHGAIGAHAADGDVVRRTGAGDGDGRGIRGAAERDVGRGEAGDGL